MKIATIYTTLKSIFAHRCFPYIAAVMAVLLPLASLKKGLKDDDFIHRMILLGETGLKTGAAKLTALFDFCNPENVPLQMNQGIAPWWTAEELRVSFFRPLAALTHWFDYQLWPDTPLAMHAHNLLWYALLCFTIALFYRRMLNKKWIAGLAALFFVLDDAHLIPVTWIANRNILIALFFGLLTLMAHDRWRREKWRPGPYLALTFFCSALLASEGGIATGAYLIAYALFIDTDLKKKRLISILPYLTIGITWRIYTQLLGFGAHSSAFYVDPGREPLRFLTGVLERFPLIISGQFGWPISIYPALSVSANHIYLGITLIFLTLLIVIFYPLLAKNNLARFWAMGMALSVFPACAMHLTSPRLLVFVGVGGMGLLAQFIGGFGDRAEWVPISGLRKTGLWIAGIIMIAVHGLWAPYQFINMSLNTEHEHFMECSLNIAPHLKTAEQDIVIVNPPSSFPFLYLKAVKHHDKQMTPAHLRMLAPGYFSMHIKRIDPKTLSVRPENGYLSPPGKIHRKDGKAPPPISAVYFFQWLDRAFQISTDALKMGRRIELPGVQIEVTALTKDGRPSEAQFRFDHPLEAASLIWLQWDWKEYAYIPFEIPAIGKTVQLPGIL